MWQTVPEVPVITLLPALIPVPVPIPDQVAAQAQQTAPEAQAAKGTAAEAPALPAADRQWLTMHVSS